MTITTRIDTDEYFIKMARLASLRGACVRRQTGCILTNNLNHVIATGYNGRARGVNNCLENPCVGAKMDSGIGLEQCEAIHAEANALLQCHNVEEIKTAYCTTAPCIHCVKLLMNTGCERVVFQDTYPHMEESERLWLQNDIATIEVYGVSRRTWEHFSEQMEIFDPAAIREEACLTNHADWLPINRPTGNEGTSFRRCVDCGLLKEVGN